MTPTVDATQSPKERVIASPGISLSLIHTLSGPICSPSSSKYGKTLPPLILILPASRASSALWSVDKGLHVHCSPTRPYMTALESPKLAQVSFCSCKQSMHVVVPEKLMSISDSSRSFAVFLNASLIVASVSPVSFFLKALFLMKQYSMFYGSISLMNSETQCPLTPCPSQTPIRYLPLIMKFSMPTQASWLTLPFLSTANPFRLHHDHFETTDSLSFRAWPCFLSSSPHSWALILTLSCDLVLPCFGFFLLCC